MDSEALITNGNKILEVVGNYWDNLRDRTPLPDVQPGFMKDLLPPTAPEDPEPWEKIVADLEKVVIAPNTHWHHPHFFAYFPTANSYPAILGDIMSSGMASIGFTWKSSPSCTELEMSMMDWLVHAMGLPEHFLHSSTGNGGGIIQGTASEATLVALLVARQRVYNRLTSTTKLADLSATCQQDPAEGVNIFGRFWRSFTSAPRAVISFLFDGILGSTDAMKDSTENECNYICFPNLVAYCSDEAHSSVDKAAILGAIHLKHVKTTKENGHALTGDALQKAIEHDLSQGKVPFFNWQIPLGRRFRSIKLWFVLRALGLNAIRHHIRDQCALAEHFASLVIADDKWELIVPTKLGLVCFRFLPDKDPDAQTLEELNRINTELCTKINADRRIHLVAATVKGVYFLRLAISSSKTTIKDVDYAWGVIREIAGTIA